MQFCGVTSVVKEKFGEGLTVANSTGRDLVASPQWREKDRENEKFVRSNLG